MQHQLSGCHSACAGCAEGTWFALNQVIRSRAIALVAEKARVRVTQVTRVTVWGNNSQYAYVDLHKGTGRRTARGRGDRRSHVGQDVFEPAVVDQGREIVRRRGTTPAGSIAQAILATIRSIMTPTPLEQSFGAGVVSDGSYDVPRRLVFGFPLVTADGRTRTIPREHYLDVQPASGSPGMSPSWSSKPWQSHTCWERRETIRVGSYVKKGWLQCRRSGPILCPSGSYLS